MKNEWSDREFRSLVKHYAERNVSEDLAARVYTGRLIGNNPKLVIHGGGNTSVKTRTVDFLGQECDVLCVKGSGWDLGDIEPEGLPAVRLEPLHEVRGRDWMSDEDMVSFLRSNLLDPKAPNPSVETLLHAYIPCKFVDHAHASAVLSLSDQPNGEEICREVFGERVAIVPFVMPGFELSKVTADMFDQNSGIEGLILHKHGIFTFGDTARESYDRMIDLVSIAEERIESAWGEQSPFVFEPASLPSSVAKVADVAPVLRGSCIKREEGTPVSRRVLAFRTSERIRAFVDGKHLSDYGTRGVVTPDHIIRTKNKPLIVPAPDAQHFDEFTAAVADAATRFRQGYVEYFNEHDSEDAPKTMLDSSPCVVLVPGIGLFGVGRNHASATVAADLAEITVHTVTDAEIVGRYEALDEKELFEMEYWSLEQAKLGRATERALEGQIALITGGAGTIGAATARLFASHGADVAVLDLDGDALESVADSIGPGVLTIEADVTDDESADSAFDRLCQHFGGIDILVSNAGAAWEGAIGELDDALLRQSFELNFFSHQRMAKQAVGIMRAQGTGGALLFNASKQAVNPGANFGAYGLPKAATLFLSRQYALEYGKFGIRSNAVNADRIRSGLLTDEMIEARARSRNQTEASYLAGNLLGQEVTADDVAQAFLHQALALKTTAGVTTVDGGNMAAALR
ncbi:MAG: bifunctional aldolase/short-chain dehydrogenase [Woeseia sp.]